MDPGVRRDDGFWANNKSRSDRLAAKSWPQLVYYSLPAHLLTEFPFQSYSYE
jgi:hypothetical protein